MLDFVLSCAISNYQPFHEGHITWYIPELSRKFPQEPNPAFVSILIGLDSFYNLSVF